MEGNEIDREAVKSRPIKIKDVIRYKVNNEWITGTIMSRAGEATGKYQTWYNIKNENNEKVKEELLKRGSTQCKLDPAVFYIQEDKKLRGVICCHVDDLLHAGDQFFKRFMNKLRVRFSAGKVEEKIFKYIGFGIQQLPSKIILDHSEYIDNIKNVTIDPKIASENNEPLNEREQTLFRQIKGQLNWGVQGSRPDMAFGMIAMSTKLKQGKVEDLLRAIKKICSLKDIRSYMTFPELDKMKELKMVVFIDASLSNINEGT